MLCHRCHGQHWIIRAGQMCPCPECGGLGEIHCCEGLIAQREDTQLPDPAASQLSEPLGHLRLGDPAQR
jgi:hypothetical protein